MSAKKSNFKWADEPEDVKQATAACKFGTLCKKHPLGQCKFAHEGGLKSAQVPAPKKGSARAAGHVAKSPKLSFSVRDAVGMVHPHVQKIAALKKQLAAPPTLSGDKDQKGGWLVVPDSDTKVLSAQIAAAESELKAQTSLARALIGNQTMEIVLTMPLMQVNTGANVTAQVFSIDPTNSSEWASLQALYDEYRFDRGHYCFQLNALGNGTTDNSMPAFVYDPADITALPSTSRACEFSQHKLFVTAITGGPGGPVYNNGEPHKFSFHVKGAQSFAINAAGATLVAAGAWKATQTAAATYVPDGYIKIYWQNNQVVATQVIAGVLYQTYHFRTRK